MELLWLAQMDLVRSELLRLHPVHRYSILLAVVVDLDLQTVELFVEPEHQFVRIKELDTFLHLLGLGRFDFPEVFLQSFDFTLAVIVKHRLFVVNCPLP